MIKERRDKLYKESTLLVRDRPNRITWKKRENIEKNIIEETVSKEIPQSSRERGVCKLTGSTNSNQDE